MVFNFSVKYNFQTHINKDKSAYGFQGEQLGSDIIQNMCLLYKNLTNVSL